ncbi:hypothetical protein ScPMuIL_011809 [Solemya velum]
MPPKRKSTKGEGETVEKPTKTKKAKKEAEAVTNETEGEAVPEKKSNSKKKAENDKKEEKPLYVPVPLEKLDMSSTATSTDGRKWNIKVVSWNINGIRAWLEKDGLAYIEREDPDIMCVQETKCALDQIPDKCKIDGYHAYWSSAEQPGYAGTGLYSKVEPIDISYGLGIEKHDTEGRLITAEFKNFFVVTSYVPNAGRGLPRLDYRTKEWDVDLSAHLKKLDSKKPVIFCGDLNVAHQEIDLAKPKGNNKTAGFTKEERQGFTNLLSGGFIDSFRHLYAEREGAYTFWTYMMNSRAKDIGWRLDYFVLSERLTKDLCDSIIRKDVMGSDHCPIVLLMAL